MTQPQYRPTSGTQTVNDNFKIKFHNMTAAADLIFRKQKHLIDIIDVIIPVEILSLIDEDI